MMTSQVEYGIKRDGTQNRILTAQGSFMAAMFVGGPSGYKVKVYKTRRGAEKAAERHSVVFPTTIFEIIDGIMHY